MMEGQGHQPVEQAGVPGKAAGIGAEVGGVRSSKEESEVYLGELSTEVRALLKALSRDSACSHASPRNEGKGDGSGQTEIITPDKIRKLQRTLYRKAKAEPKYRFWSLYGDIIRPDVLEYALRAVSSNGGAPGVDGQTIAGINGNAEGRQRWLTQLQEELKNHDYRPQPVRRVMIPKSNGGQRPLGIPTVKDRVVQMAATLVLMPIFEADFHPRSYGFRPRRNAHQAIDEIVRALRSGRCEVLDAALSKYLEGASYYTPVHGVVEKSCGCWSKTRIRKPFCRPRETWTMFSSPRLTRCMIVCRETPRMRMASGMAT